MSQKINIDELSKPQVRRHMRARRANLSLKEQLFAEQNLYRQSRKCSRLLQAKQILSYAPFAGEIAPNKLIEKLATTNIFFPRITNFRLCQMRLYSASKVENLNKYGIEEPKAIGAPQQANRLDVMLLPLVAFDRQGNRIGMGRGYYDRALQSLSHQNSTRPFLIGVAHYFQEVKSCQAAAWDVPLDAILTDREFILIKR